MTAVLPHGPVSAVLTDIEGTTSAIAFVKETLFPYAEARLDAFLDAREGEPEVAAALRVCYEEYTALRVGGDLIFRVLKTVVARMERRMDK